MKENNSPNIIWITTDHHLFYGHEGVLRPNYERFCQSAAEFTDAYTVCPLCCPARRSMLSGLYPHKHGVTNNNNNPPLTEETYYTALLKRGYNCTYIGKWHAGCRPHIDNVEMLTSPGYGCPYTWDDYHAYLSQKNLDNPAAYIEYSMSQRNFYVEKETLDLTRVENLFSLTFGTLTSDKESHEMFYLANRAVEALSAAAAQKSPFCLRVDFWGPHHPYFPTKEFLDMYDADKIALYPSLHDTLDKKPSVYFQSHGEGIECGGKLIRPTPLSDNDWRRMLHIAYAHTTMADAAIGRILDAAESINDKNTVVIITSDHGDALASHGGHIDKDAFLSQEVLRIPLAIRAKNLPARKYNCLVSNLDIPVTVAGFAGGFESGVDGKELQSLTDKPREYFVSVTHGHFTQAEGRALICGDYKYIYNHLDTEELYNLANDKYELYNLANDPSYASVMTDMRTKLLDWQRQYNDPLLLQK